MEISKRSELLDIVAESQGDSLSVRYIRDGEEKVCSITPEKNENGAYLLGAWVKDDVSGIGTVTFVDGTNFMALGTQCVGYRYGRLSCDAAPVECTQRILQI